MDLTLSATGGSTMQSVPEGGFLGQVSFDSFNQTAESLVNNNNSINRDSIKDSSNNNENNPPANRTPLEGPDEERLRLSDDVDSSFHGTNYHLVDENDEDNFHATPDHNAGDDAGFVDTPGHNAALWDKTRSF